MQVLVLWIFQISNSVNLEKQYSFHGLCYHNRTVL